MVFLSPASALALSLHPLFTGQDLDDKTPDVIIKELSAIAAVGGLTLTGRIAGDPKPVALIAFNDPASDPPVESAAGLAEPRCGATFRSLVFL